MEDGLQELKVLTESFADSRVEADTFQMEDNEITDVAERIEKSIPPDVAVIKYMQHGGGLDESHIIANRTGYLRLTALFLRASVAPHEKPGSAVIDVDAWDILDEDSDIGIGRLERREDFEKVEYEGTVSDTLSLLGCVIVVSFAPS